MGRSRSNYSYSSPRTPVTKPPINALTPNTVKVEQPGFFSNVMQGFGMGAGQSMAFNLFKPFQSSSNNSSSNISSDIPAAVKDLPKEYVHLPRRGDDIDTANAAFVQCMKEYDNKKDLCKQYLDETDNL